MPEVNDFGDPLEAEPRPTSFTFEVVRVQLAPPEKSVPERYKGYKRYYVRWRVRIPCSGAPGTFVGGVATGIFVYGNSPSFIKRLIELAPIWPSAWQNEVIVSPMLRWPQNVITLHNLLLRD